MFDPRLLRTLVAVVESGSFTHAAARLHSTQSTVSQHLSRLENAVAQQLIDRTARPVVATAAGERLLGYARRILALQDEALQSLRDAKRTAALRIGLPDDVITIAMSRRLASFVTGNGDVRLDVTTGLSRDILRRFRAGELDIAVVKESAPGPGARASLPEPLAWFGSAEPGYAAPDPLPLVAFPPGGLYRDLMIGRLEQEGRNWHIAVTGNSLSSVLTAVEAGIGVSVLPVSAVQGRLVRPFREFGREGQMSISIYAWEGDGPIGELIEGMIKQLGEDRRGTATDGP
ncbi:MAG: LysR family transcriptional regulator [Sphingomonadales bacterium]|nr:MAG: LysR family transcriptional regulator [Sphingomonadales bacterium]